VKLKADQVSPLMRWYFTLFFKILYLCDNCFKFAQNELYCLRCHDKMGIPICGACRRPIEERVVTALGKHFHVEV
jgi:hypothetical protein